MGWSLSNPYRAITRSIMHSLTHLMRKTIILLTSLTLLIAQHLPSRGQQLSSYGQQLSSPAQQLSSYGQHRLSPYLRSLVMAGRQGQPSLNAKPGAAGARVAQRVMLLAKTSEPERLRQHGARIIDNIGDIYIIDTPVTGLEAMSRERGVERLEAGLPCTALMDTTATITHADRLWDAIIPGRDATGLAGRGVMIGVMDVGFDVTHPVFLGEGGMPRVAAFWDQLDTLQTGRPVEGTDTVYVGRQYLTPDEIKAKAFSTDSRLTAHGTHTASTALMIATGQTGGITSVEDMHSRYAHPSKREGATLCLVSNYTSDGRDAVSDERRSLYTTATDILGFKYIFDRAAELSMPCVINFSEGAHDDLYESRLYCEAIERLTGPGRIICSSAGNEAYKGTYMAKPQGRERAGAFIATGSNQAFYTIASAEPPTVELTFYDDSQGKKETVAYDLTRLREYPDSVELDTINTPTSRYITAMVIYPSCYDDGRYATELLVMAPDEKTLPDAISIEIVGKENDIEVYASGGWFRTDSHDTTLSSFTRDHNILFPSSARGVVCVGGTAYRTGQTNYKGEWMSSDVGREGRRMSYSSCGPTMAGLTKPDIMAPGANIIAAYNSLFMEKNPDDASRRWNVMEFDYDGRHHAWNSNSGTSMSSPVATGIIAQWLELCPTLSPSDIITIAANTATHPENGLTYPNNMYGYGQIDAYAGAMYISDHYTGISSPSLPPSSTVETWYDVAGRRVNGMPQRPGLYISSGGKKLIRR